MMEEPQQMPVNQLIHRSGPVMLCSLGLGKRGMKSAVAGL